MLPQPASPGLVKTGFVMMILALPFLAFGLPIATAATHGLDLAMWPPEATTLAEWESAVRFLQAQTILDQYYAMMVGRHPGFHHGGVWQLWVMAVFYVLAVHWTLAEKSTTDKRRDPSGQLGAARWADEVELAEMDEGVELGRNPQTGKSVRVSVEGNLLSIAPPRSGKTSGLVINNLLVPDDSAWSGPAVIVDPKGEVYQAVARRRKELGRRVIKFDLRKGAQGSDHWNPIAELDPDDIEHFQTIASALIPNMGDQNAFFGIRGVDVFAGAIAVAIREASQSNRIATPADVAELLSDPERLLLTAKDGDRLVLRSLAGDMGLSDKERDQLLSTAKTGVQWLMDERFQRVTSASTFSMAEVARGQADLFIILPPKSKTTLAPLLRWMFVELFAALEEKREAEDDRVLMFVDEANSLGRFDALVEALALLPGRGVSIWTFWQSRAQIIKHYGEEGLEAFADSAEITTLSNIGRLGKAAEILSRALDNFTTLINSKNTQVSPGGESSSTNESRQSVPLMRTDEIKSLKGNELIVLLNSTRYGTEPVRLKKIRYFADERFDGLHEGVAPAKRL